MSVIVEHLKKRFGDQNAVNDISFTAHKGEITGFLGPNGAGKSTTMKIITCFNPLTSGSVKVCGFDTETESLEIRKRIGYLPEHNPLYLDLYVREYLTEVGKLHKIPKKELQSRVEQMIALCGLIPEQNKKIRQLSKGYRQRVGLAQALIHDPEVLILDEPTSGLDPNQLKEIRDLIKNISKNKTVILSTHIMQEVQALCDRVVIINKGKLVANDKVSALTTLQNEHTTLKMVFSQGVNPEVFSTLSYVLDAQVTNDKTIQVTLDGTTDRRHELLRYCVEQKLPLVEFYMEEKNIEDVFRSLTTNSSHV